MTCCLAHTAGDMLFLKTGVFLVEFLKILKKDIHTSIYQNDFQSFRKAVIKHKEIIKCHENLNGYFVPLIFGRYLVVTAEICVLGFQIMMVYFLPTSNI